jgi:choline-glycine betaine transporter
MAALAAILLVTGGGGSDALNGLTNGAILAATPFGILMVPMCYGLYKTLKVDYREERRELQEALAYDRDAERRQLEEIRTGQPSRLRWVRAPQAIADRPTSNGRE